MLNSVCFAVVTSELQLSPPPVKEEEAQSDKGVAGFCAPPEELFPVRES
jgi:hypothetical protein